MSELIDDVADYLQAQSLGTVGTSIFESTLPDDPDNCLAVIDTGGPAQDTNLTWVRRTFQVIVRNTSYATGHATLNSIRSLLHKKMNASLVSGGTYYYSIMAMSAGGHIGRDDSNREEFSINFEALAR